MEVLKPLIHELVEMIRKGKDVISGNLPDAIQQIIIYETWSDIFWIKISVPILVAGSVCIYIDYKDTQEFRVHGFLVFGIALVLMSFTVAIANYCDLQKMKLAPKIYMIEVLTNYLKEQK